VTDIVKSQGAALAVLQPLLGRLITANVKVPGHFRYAIKILVVVI
jgi:hypothetical protein